MANKPGRGRIRCYDVIVVGAGHNGLTAAFYFARAGLATLVLERREIVGGACVTEEIMPGVRASTTSYIASMLRPEVIRDLRLGEHGLKMVACEPGVQSAFEDGTWCRGGPTTRRTVAEFAKHLGEGRQGIRRRPRPPREAGALPAALLPGGAAGPVRKGWKRVHEARRAFKRFRSVTGDEISDLIRFTTGSLGDFVERHYESEKIRRMYLAIERVRHARAAVPPRHRDRPDVPHALGWRRRGAGLLRPRGRRHGRDHAAMASAATRAGAEIRTEASVARIETRGGRTIGVVLDDGTEIAASTVSPTPTPSARTWASSIGPSSARTSAMTSRRSRWPARAPR